ncbi:uncharacterized protein V6R79_016307 [Siganus canaliculatus]
MAEFSEELGVKLWTGRRRVPWSQSWFWWCSGAGRSLRADLGGGRDLKLLSSIFWFDPNWFSVNMTERTSDGGEKRAAHNKQTNTQTSRCGALLLSLSMWRLFSGSHSGKCLKCCSAAELLHSGFSAAAHREGEKNNLILLLVSQENSVWAVEEEKTADAHTQNASSSCDSVRTWTSCQRELDSSMEQQLVLVLVLVTWFSVKPA